MASRGVVVLVDDNQDDVFLARLLMTEAHFPFEMLVAFDGEEAWSLISRLSAPPSLLVLDIKMPRMGGLELLARVRGELGWREVPVAILTSSDDPGDITRAEALGANVYIRKPSDVTAFQGVIERLKEPAALLGARMARW